MRRKLPDRRNRWHQYASVGGTTIHLSVGEYEDGAPGEIFLDVSKSGSAVRTMLNVIAMYFSMALQYGVPIHVLLAVIDDLSFEPSGPVEGCSEVKQANSILDYIAKLLKEAYPPPDFDVVQMGGARTEEKVAGAHKTGSGA